MSFATEWDRTIERVLFRLEWLLNLPTLCGNCKMICRRRNPCDCH